MNVFIRLAHIFRVQIISCIFAAHINLMTMHQITDVLGKVLLLGAVASGAGGGIKEKSASYSHALPQTDSHLHLDPLNPFLFLFFSST